MSALRHLLAAIPAVILGTGWCLPSQAQTWPDDPLPASFKFPAYVTLIDPTTVFVCWKTDVATMGYVEYGTSSSYGQTSGTTASIKKHFVQLSGLLPQTPYFYRVRVVGSSSTMRGTFTTPGQTSFRFAQFGEFHAANKIAAVAAFANTIRAFEPHFIVESGDMLDTGTSESDLLAYMTTSRPWLPNTFLLPCYSNHVRWQNGVATNLILANFKLPDDHGNGRRPWYSTRYGSVQILTLDSNDSVELGYTVNEAEQLDWLAQQLREARDGINDPIFLICTWHHPAYASSNDADYPAESNYVRTKYLSTIEANGGVDLILVGHEHFNEVSKKSYADGSALWQVQSCIGDLEGGRFLDINPYRVYRNDTSTAVLLAEVNGNTLVAQLVNSSNSTLHTLSLSKPTAPSLVVPANGSSTSDATPVFDWSNVSDPSGVTYQLRVDNTSDFSSAEIAVSNLTASTFTAASALPDGLYYWRVRAVDGDGSVGVWSPVRTVRIDTTPPPAPSLLAPANGASTSDTPPTFDWSDVSDPSGVTYRLRVDNGGSSFPSPEIVVNGLTASTYTPGSALASGTYSWRVRAVDGAGNLGLWSPVRTVTISP